MSNWQEFKKTIVRENAVFDYAREGDTEKLVANLASLDSINEKNFKGYSVLMLAAYNGQVETTRRLILLGADVNSVDATSNSILMGVAFKGHAEIARMLVNAGADIDYQNKKSQTAMQFAEMFSKTEVIEVFNGVKNTKFQTLFQTIKAWARFLIQRRRGEAI